MVALARAAVDRCQHHPGRRRSGGRHLHAESGGGLLSGIWGLITLIPAILVDIKRWHDRDKSGWWMLIVLVPIIGWIWFIVELGFLKGTPGPNRFGPPVTD